MTKLSSPTTQAASFDLATLSNDLDAQLAFELAECGRLLQGKRSAVDEAQQSLDTYKHQRDECAKRSEALCAIGSPMAGGHAASLQAAAEVISEQEDALTVQRDEISVLEEREKRLQMV